MSLRQILVKSAVFWRYRRAKKRAMRDRAVLLAEITALKEKTDRFEQLLLREKLANAQNIALAAEEWASRLLALQNLPPAGMYHLAADEKLNKDPVFGPRKLETRPSVLDPQQNAYLNDIKQAFWEDGREAGKTEEDIEFFWHQKEKEIIDQVRVEFGSGTAAGDTDTTDDEYPAN